MTKNGGMTEVQWKKQTNWKGSFAGEHSSLTINEYLHILITEILSCKEKST